MNDSDTLTNYISLVIVWASEFLYTFGTGKKQDVINFEIKQAQL